MIRGRAAMDRDDKLAALYRDNRSIRQCAVVFGISHQRVHQILSGRGDVVMRPRSHHYGRDSTTQTRATLVGTGTPQVVSPHSGD